MVTIEGVTFIEIKYRVAYDSSQLPFRGIFASRIEVFYKEPPLLTVATLFLPGNV